ncbi:MAG: hypothetical protein PF689_04495 [Deltaproteobacteria bacterium]|nr:hypothetical protein [Deltaproteobacteria bacterium]
MKKVLVLQGWKQGKDSNISKFLVQKYLEGRALVPFAHWKKSDLLAFGEFLRRKDNPIISLQWKWKITEKNGRGEKEEN